MVYVAFAIRTFGIAKNGHKGNTPVNYYLNTKTQPMEIVNTY